MGELGSAQGQEYESPMSTAKRSQVQVHPGTENNVKAIATSVSRMETWSDIVMRCDATRWSVLWRKRAFGMSKQEHTPSFFTTPGSLLLALLLLGSKGLEVREPG